MRQHNGWWVAVALLVAGQGCWRHSVCAPPVGVAPPCAGCGQPVTSGAPSRYPPPVTAAPMAPAGIVPGMGSAPLPPGRPLPPPTQPPIVEENFTRATPPAAAPTSPLQQQSSARLQSPREDAITPAGGSTGPTEIPQDIPQFNVVYDKVATGLQPFPDGYTWLQKQGYKTVILLRLQGEDDTASRQSIERLGLKYVSLEINPAKITREQVAQFSNLVRDQAAQPLFVTDRKGYLAGAFWYLHFRLVEQMAEAPARARAQRLGLAPATDADPDLTELWQALQAVLNQK